MTVLDLRGESEISKVGYVDDILRFIFADGETDERYELSVKTDVFYSKPLPEYKQAMRVEIQKLRELLIVEEASGIYLLPEGLSAQMKAKRQASHLAVGLKAPEYPFLFQVVSSSVYLACPIPSVESVKVALLPNTL